jgi:succinate dehydrogenase/fumarate reductase flavoprotein subunit
VTEVLVVGGEGAGLRAAIEASDKGARTTLVSKGRIGKSGATMLAGADITLDGKSASKIGLAGNENDSPEKFFRDILIQGYHLNNQKLVEAYVRDAPARTKEMIDWGMKYAWDGKRAVISQGIEINRVLVDQVRKRPITVMEDVYVTNLLTQGHTVVGAFGLDINRGVFVVLRSKAVVIATGGWQRAYSFTSAPEGLTGDLHAAAFRAGADLLNMEMVTFCPNAILWPPAFRGDIFPYLLVEMFGDMLDKHGQPYLREYDQRIFKIATTTEWNKLIFCIASTRAVRSGNGSPRGGTYYSIKAVPSNIIEEGEKLFPGWKWLKTDYSDLIKWLREGNAVEVAPAAHYMEGGIRVNEFAATTLRGLYAAGECSGGLFGANRVASAITQILVQGAIGGTSGAEYAKSNKLKEPNPEQVKNFEAQLTEPFGRKTGVRPVQLLKRIRKIADEHLWVIRDGKGLKTALDEIELIRSELPRIVIHTQARACNREWIDAIQINGLVTVLEASTRGALMRKESRGVHYRSDYPQTDNDRWLKEIIVRQVGGKPVLKTAPVTVTKAKLPKGKFGFEDGIVRAVKALGE